VAEAVKHVVWEEMEKAKLKPVRPPSNTEPAIPHDPLTSFENFVPRLRADLHGWMTFDKKGRMDRCKWFVNTHYDEINKMTPARRLKTLAFIVYMEASHPLGDSDVAAMAFKGLFPGHTGKKASKEPEKES